MSKSARILSTATATPPFILSQDEVASRIEVLLGGSTVELTRLLPVFSNTGIATRYSCVPLEWYESAHDWPERNRIYLSSALDLLEDVTRKALAKCALNADAIDAIVVVSTTGIATPSLDALLMDRMGLKPQIQRLPIFGLGCAGGVIGLARAATMAQSRPGSIVLFLVVELCALSFRKDDLSKSNIVASALFGDGAAAVVLSTTGPGTAVGPAGEHTFPGSLGIMGWDVMTDGMRAIFSRDIPSLVTRELRSVAEDFLERHGLGLADIDSYVCHPGGAKVLDAIAVAFRCDPKALDHARSILRDYGNMSAATVIFVLDRLLSGSTSWDRALMSTLGPGFSTAFLVLEAA